MAAAARAHRATRTDDVLACVFSQLELFDGCVGAAFVCKQWHTAWRKNAKGLYRPVNLRVGGGQNRFPGGMKALDAGGGVVISDTEEHCLYLYSSDGVQVQQFRCDAFDGPNAVTLDGDGALWLSHDEDQKVSRVHVDWATMELSELPSYEVNFWDRGCRVHDLAISGDSLVVLCVEFWRWGIIYVLDQQTGAIRYEFGSDVAPGGDDELRDPYAMALGGDGGDYCFVADTHNQSVAVFNWRDGGTFVRRFGKPGTAPFMEGRFDDEDEYWNSMTYDDDRKSTEPGEFTEPCGIAIRGQTLYVSDSGSVRRSRSLSTNLSRVQILRLPDDLSGPEGLEVLQILTWPPGGGFYYDPGGGPSSSFSNLILDGDRLWVVGGALLNPIPRVRANQQHYWEYYSNVHIWAPIV